MGIPLAWWLSRKLAALAEQACDDAVLARGHDPEKYAELLLELARSVRRRGALVTAWGSSLDGSTLVVLASSVTPVPPNPVPSGPFVIGDLQVQPNVTSEYVNGQFLLPVLQVYNATVDPATGKPALDVSFAIKSGNLFLETIEDTAGKRIQLDSNDQVTIIHSIPVRNLTPGQYTLEIEIVDRLSKRTLVTGADFHVVSPRRD
jgi:hypothetical protein